MSNKEQAQAAKNRGNAAFSSKDFKKAVEEFSTAIELDPSDHIFYSNRSGAYTSLEQYEQALQDANKCIEISASFTKGYGRKGAALYGLGRFSEAVEAYESGLKVDPNNAQLKEGLSETKKAMEKPSGGAAGANPFGSIFGPDMFTKLASDPSTAPFLADPGFRTKMQLLQTNPKLLGQYLQDPQVSAALGVLLNIGSGAFKTMDPEEMNRMEEEEREREKQKKKQEQEEADRKKKEEEAKKEAELPDEEKQKLAMKKQAQAEKEKGNEFYKKKQFEDAIKHYDAAIELDPTNITFLNNKSAVYFEMKEYDRVIELCQKAIELGKEYQANFADRARAWERIGNVYSARNQLSEAIDAYERSLLESHSDKVRTNLKKLVDQKKKMEANAYLDKAKSEEAKERGNELYKTGKFVEAIEQYTDAIKRDPENYKAYTNRANCYSKLMEWGKAMQDCDKALAIDPKFIKAYIRKGKIHQFLKQYHKALEAYDKGLAIEPSNAEIMDERRKTIMAINSGEADPERAKRAMEDPEIQAILRDPTINKVLQDMQESPQTAQAALRDPDIKSKIEKLVAAGVLQVK